MALRIGDAIGDGVKRAVSYSGGVLMALMFVYQVLFVGAVNRITAAALPPELQESNTLGLVLPVPVGIAAGVAVVGLLFGIVLYLVATRALTRPHADLDSLPAELGTRRIGRATLSAVGANLVVSLAVLVGFLFLVVPGIFLAVSFLFVVFAIGVEDAGAIDALRRSWTLASGDRWSLLAVALLVGLITGVGSGIGSALSVVAPVAGQVASLALAAVFTVIGYGILADTYLQLTDEPAGEPDAGSPTAEADPVA